MIEIGKLYRMAGTDVDPSNFMTLLLNEQKEWRFYPVLDTYFVVIEKEGETYKLLMPDGNLVKCFASESRYIPTK
jgi:hypothetical protein